jgi:hypothetical protein
MGHGFAGTRDVALPFFAQRFAASGLAALVIDYRHFGASGGAPRQLIDPWEQPQLSCFREIGDPGSASLRPALFEKSLELW